MEKFKLNLFEIFSLFWISAATFGLVFAILGIFTPTLIIIGLILLAAFFAILHRSGVWTLKLPSKLSIILILIIFALGIFLSLTTIPTIFGGRDEGSYSTAAIMLANDHSLNHTSPLIKDFFKIYGPGKALNFPGFYYTAKGQLQSQFMPGYISWLAVLYSLFGLAGLKFANLLPFFTFLFCFYLVLRKILSGNFLMPRQKNSQNKPATTFSIFGFVFLLSTFPLIIFYKYTLSEIFYASLIWFTFYLLLKYFEEKSFVRYFLLFLPFPLMLFSRIETLGFVVILLGVFILKDFNHMRLVKYRFIFVLLAIVTAISLAYNSNFFIDTGKNIIAPLLKAKTPAAPGTIPALSDDLAGFYVFRVLFNYNILPYLLMGLVTILALFKKMRLRLLIPFLFFLPTLIYLIDANISLDHPWMLRRFVFSIIPLFILYSVLFLYEISQRKLKDLSLAWISYAIAILIVGLNVLLIFPSFSKYNFLAFSQNKNLLGQTENFSKKFAANDLILVSQNSSDSGWSLISEPLRTIHQKQTVYFFNPNDLSKINRGQYQNIYLIASQKDGSLFDSIRKEIASPYEFDNEIIYLSKDPSRTTEIRTDHVQGTVYKLIP